LTRRKQKQDSRPKLFLAFNIPLQPGRTSPALAERHRPHEYYRFGALAASQFVQAMPSLVWSANALVLMRFSARRVVRRSWWSGAFVLGIVVLKLFLVDLANGGSIALVVSFVGTSAAPGRLPCAVSENGAWRAVARFRLR
jgi:hypothetical protein